MVNPLPNAHAGPDEMICDGESVQLIATGGVQYLWNTGDTNNTLSVTPAVSSTYTVTVTDANGCSATDEADVIVHPLPVASIAGASELCITTFIDLVATGGDTYSWGTGETSATITVSPSVSTDYHVTVTDVNGCTATASHHVAVNENDQADAGPDQQICIGETTQVTASGGDIFLWNTGETTSTIVIAPSSSTTYSVTVTDDDGCTDEDEVLVVVNPLPNADAGADMQSCQGEPVILSASGGDSYLWSNGETSSSISIALDTTSMMVVTVTDSNGCTDYDEILVTILDLPSVILTDDLDICLGATANLAASGGGTYLWSTGETTDQISVSPNVSTTYSVSVTNAEECLSTQEVIVTVNELPMANASEDQDICDGESAQLVGAGGIAYLWSTGEATDTIQVSPTQNSTYYMTVTDANGCTAEDEVTVYVHDYPTADAGSFGIACGANGAMLTATGGFTYLWSNGDTNAMTTVFPTTSFQFYSVTVYNEFGCEDEADVPVFMSVAPTADAGEDIEICPGGQAEIFGSGGDDYLWLPDLYLDNNTSSFVISTPDTTITYTLIVSDESGCTDSDQVTVTIVNDTEPPVALCQDIFVNADASGEGTFTADQINAGSYDNCGDVTLSLDQTSVYCLLLDYSIVLTVTDAFGNSSTCESTVSLQGPDLDCDLVANGCDLCTGGDDKIDNDNDGLPDCAFPPVNPTDLEELWKCGLSSTGEQKVWVCHAPFQSICIDYSQVFTHVSFHHDDYLGPCFAIGCFFDSQEKPQNGIDGLASEYVESKELQISCLALINDLSINTDDVYETLKSSVDIEASVCDVVSVDMNVTEEDLLAALSKPSTFLVDFMVRDKCGHMDKCTSSIKPDLEELILFPNPASSDLHVAGLMGESYFIYNIQGEKVTPAANNAILDVQDLAAGIYILQTESGRNSKFVILR